MPSASSAPPGMLLEPWFQLSRSWPVRFSGRAAMSRSSSLILLWVSLRSSAMPILLSNENGGARAPFRKAQAIATRRKERAADRLADDPLNDRKRDRLLLFGFAFGFSSRRFGAVLVDLLDQDLGDDRSGRFLEHLGDDVDALRLKLGLFGRAGDVDVDGDRNFRVKSDLHVLHSDRLDRAVQHDLALGDLGAFGFQSLDDVAGGDRAVELAGVGCLADQLDGLSVDRLRVLLGGRAALGILGLDPGAVGFEQLAVRVVGTERFLVRKQVVAGKAVLHID